MASLDSWVSNLTQQMMLMSDDPSLDQYASLMSDSDGNHTMSDTHPPTNQLISHVIKVIYAAIFVVGIIGNSLVLYVVVRFSKMQTVTNMYIFNLAMADESFLMGLPFLIITLMTGHWPFSSAMCKVYMTMSSITQFTSSLLLTVMSADRYIAVCHPISSPQYRTPFIARCICLTVWSISALLMLPIVLFSKTVHYNDTQSCIIDWPASEVQMKIRAFTTYNFALGFFIPCVLILLFYVLVICKLRKVGPKNKSKEKKRTHRKVTFLVLTVITVYVLCWLPYWINQLMMVFGFANNQHLMVPLTLMTGCMSYANSAINPILYAFLSENFKKSFVKAFACTNSRDLNDFLNGGNSAAHRTTRAMSSRGPQHHKSRVQGAQGGGGHGDPMEIDETNLNQNNGNELQPTQDMVMSHPIETVVSTSRSSHHGRVRTRDDDDLDEDDFLEEEDEDDDDDEDNEEGIQLVDVKPISERITNYMMNRESNKSMDKEGLLPSTLRSSGTEGTTIHPILSPKSSVDRTSL